MSQPPSAADTAAGYQPLSGLVIAGFTLALLCATTLVVMAAVALSSGVPLLLEPLALGLPLLAFLMCLGGRWQVLHSEGTRAGLTLARWGMILSALTGGGYWGWYFGKGLAVEREARAFADAWLARLRDSKTDPLNTYVAFWDTQDPDRRDPQSPLNDPQAVARLRDQPAERAKLVKDVYLNFAYGGEGRAKWPAFRDSDLVQLLGEAGPNAKVTPRGLRTWTYRGKAAGGYEVELNYEIETPDGTAKAVISVLSSSGERGRQWQTLFDGTVLEPAVQRQWTPAGQVRQALRLDSREFARDWVRKLNGGLREEAYLDTLPVAERVALRHRLAASRFASLLSPALTDAEIARAALLPGFAEFASGQLVDSRTLVADPEIAPTVRKYVAALFQPAAPGTMIAPSVAADDAYLASPWRLDPASGALILPQPFVLRIPPNFACEGRIIVASASPALGNAMTTGTGVPLPPAQRPLRWRVIGVELDFGTILARPHEK